MHLAMSSSFGGKAALLAIIASSTTTTTILAAETETSYGVDVSFPQHHRRVVVPGISSGDGDGDGDGDASSSSLLLLPGRQDFYDAFLESCRHHDDHDACDENENDRIAMNLRQPQSMVNYTKTGYAVATVPEGVFKVMRKFWEDNLGREEVEEWDTGNTYTNHVSLSFYSIYIVIIARSLCCMTIFDIWHSSGYPSRSDPTRPVQPSFYLSPELTSRFPRCPPSVS